jgi:hypothetical protein
MLWLERMLWALPAIGALIWRIFPTQLNDSELIRGSLNFYRQYHSRSGCIKKHFIEQSQAAANGCKRGF